MTPRQVAVVVEAKVLPRTDPGSQMANVSGSGVDIDHPPARERSPQLAESRGTGMPGIPRRMRLSVVSPVK
jgi:hypothetical protein